MKGAAVSGGFLQRARNNIVRVFKYRKVRMLNSFMLIVLGFASIYPLYYALLASLSTPAELSMSLLLPIPGQPFASLSNYALVFRQAGLIRSLIITMLRIACNFAVVVLVSVFGGFAFARMNFPFKRFFFLFLLSTMMVPGVAMMIPNYIWYNKFPLLGGNNLLGEGGTGLVNNLSIYFVTGWVNVYNIFLFRQAFTGFGKELIESARVDGCGFLRTMFFICIPLVKPLIIVLLINISVGIWGDYMTNIVFLRTPETSRWHTIGSKTIELANYYSDKNRVGGADYPKAYAIMMVAMLPPILLFSLLQRQFVEGLTSGAVKG